MPLLTWAAASLVAGLLLGYAELAGAGAAIAGVIAIAGVARRRRERLGLAAMLAGGLLVARADEAHRAACRARLVRASAWRIVLEDAAAPGAYVAGSVEQDGCRVRATMSVTRGVARAGDVALVRGDASVAPRGLRIAHADLASAAPASALLTLRAAAGARIDTLFGADAPLVRALLIADQRAIDPAMRDRFAAAGIVHMLSISGLHVAIIAAAVRLLFVALRLRPAPAMIATMVVVAGYVAIIGAPPPALRSGVMLGAGALAKLFQRPLSAWGVLALGALAPLADPSAVLDLGYQLSVLGMASLLCAAIVTKRWIAPRGRGWRAGIAAVGVTSALATLVSAPLVAWWFGRVSLIAPLTNIVATPVVALLQPMLFLALALAPWPAAARFVAGAAHPVLAAFTGIARAGAAVPGASITVAPSLAGALLCGAAAVALLVAGASWSPWRPLALALALLGAAAWLPDVLFAPRGMELHVIDVGQGDAVAIRTPRGRWILTDAGRAWPGGDAGRATVIPYLRVYGGAIALFVLTHPHADHVGGAASVFRALHPRDYWDGAFAGTSEPYLASLLAADSARVPWHRAHPGDSLAVDGVILRVLAPDSTWTVQLRDPNAASVVTRIEYGATRFLLMGDAEHGEEDRLLARDPGALRADVLKVGHHGSRTSSGDEFLAAVRPRLAIISVGAGNMYGHPDREILDALTRAGASVLRTDALGSIIVRSDGAHLDVQAGGARWRVRDAPP